MHEEMDRRIQEYELFYAQPRLRDAPGACPAFAVGQVVRARVPWPGCCRGPGETGVIIGWTPAHARVPGDGDWIKTECCTMGAK